MAGTDARRRFGALLRRYRLAAGLTHERLAERAAVSARAISDLERGVSSRPRTGTLARLAEALALGSEDRATLEHAARWGPDAPTHADVALGSGTLPVPLTSFVGREREVRVLREWLRQGLARLITVTGPGGAGKTRLATHVVDQADRHARHEAFYVPLAPVAGPDLVARAIARAVGSHDETRAGFSEVIEQLRNKDALLLLDNFEHVLGAAPGLLALLRGCPRVTLLVTSRAALRLSGEQEFRVAPLPLPNRSELPPVEVLARWPGIALFVDRARLVAPDFAITDETAPIVAELCHRLDGLPLAIELAAARMAALSPRAMLDLLDAGPPGSTWRLLGRGARDLPARHRTLRATIEWSYTLLPPEERRLFRHLAVFAGGCTLDAAEAIDHATPKIGATMEGHDLDVLDGLASLVDKSLVYRADGVDGETRFMMLETIREFALEQLRAHGEEAAARGRHAAHYLAIVETTGALLFASERRRFRQAGDRDNIEAALRWLVQHG